MNPEDRIPDAGSDLSAPPDESRQQEETRRDERAAPLLDPVTATRVEEEDRKRPIPGGEPSCPLCGQKMVRRVERYPAPHGGGSPFRVRLVCPGGACGAWTVYEW